MLDRFSLRALVLASLLLPLASCSVSPSLTSIAITPNAPVTVTLAPQGVAQGYSQYTAIGSYTRSGHTAETENITNQVTWSSSAPQVATINSSGVATATGFNPTTGIAWIGNTTISASMSGFGGEAIVSNDVIFTVSACTNCTSTSTEPITALSITPTTDSVALPGQTGQFIALGTSGTTGLPTNMTTLVAWSSSNVGVATIGANTGLAMAVGPGTTQITAIYTNPDKSVVEALATFTVTGSASEPLQSIAITPVTQSILAGQTSQLIAIGTFSPTAPTPGTQNLTSSVKWASSNTSIASITNPGGLVTAVGPGAAVITAIATNPDTSVVTATATVNVTGGSSSSEPLVSLAVLPASQTSLTTGASANVNFIAIGTTGSGGTVLLTSAVQTVNGQTIDPVSWTSSNPAVASIKATGIATPLSGGTTAITAIATNPDGTVVTGSAAYTVTVPTVSEPLVSLAVSPAAQSVQVGNQTANFIAIATTGLGATVNLTDPKTYTIPGTSPAQTIQWAQWTSSDPAVAAIDPNTGIITAKAAGVTAITAIAYNPDNTVVSSSAVLSVTAAVSEPLVSLAVVPTAQTSLATGTTANVNFIAIGTTSSGATVNLTTLPYTVPGSSPAVVIPVAKWSSSNQLVASFASPTGGIATPNASGATAITAIVTNPDGSVVTGSAAYTVSVPATTEPYVSLTIVPASQMLTSVGQQAKFIAIGTTGTGSTVDLTGQATWTSSDANGKIVTQVGGTSVFTAVANGAVAVTATFNNSKANGNASDLTSVTASAAITVTIGTPEPLLSLSILPNSQAVAGTGQLPTQFLAIGNFATSSSTPGNQNMTNGFTSGSSVYTVDWYSSNPSVAAVCNSVASGITNPASCPSATPGLVVAAGQGVTAITAVATNTTDKSGATASATFTVTGGAVQPVSTLSIFPGAPSLTLPLIGSATVNFIAIGTNGSTGLQTNVNSLTGILWTSTNPLVATVDNTGKATAISAGTTTIAVTYTNPASSGSGVVTATTTLTVLAAASEPLLTTTIYPVSPSVASPGLTSQLVDIGTFSSVPITQDVTKGIVSYPITTNWSSSTPAVATVTTVCPTGLSALSCTISACPGTSNAGVCTSCPGGTVASGASCATLNPTTPVGLVMGLSQGTTAIMAVSSNPDGSQVIASAPFSVTAGTSEEVSKLTIIPASVSATSSAQQNQLIALATEGNSGLQYDVTNQVVWKSNTPLVASICTAGDLLPCTPATDGLVTAATAGSTIITATWTNLDNSEVVAQATYSVTIGASPEPLISINVVPLATVVSNKGMTQQYLAFGTFTTIPTIRDITDSVTWITLEPNLVSINSAGTPGEPAGLATAMGYEGLGVIYAEDTTANPDGTLVLSNPVTFTCEVEGITPPICSQAVAPSLLATLTVFNAGSNDTNWLITAPSGTQIASGQTTCDVTTGCLIHCGPGSEIAGYGNSVCTGTYAANTNVTITASLSGNSTSTEFTTTFGGWTANCDTGVLAANGLPEPDMTSTCTLPTPASGGDPSGLYGDQSVGALFYGLTLQCSSVTSDPVGTAFPINSITVSNGTAPYTFSVVGTLPAGLTLNASTGAVTGTPTASGSFSITATDVDGTNAGATCPITIN
jgi:uncharacterized protein YjdB